MVNPHLPAPIPHATRIPMSCAQSSFPPIFLPIRHPIRANLGRGSLSVGQLPVNQNLGRSSCVHSLLCQRLQSLLLCKLILVIIAPIILCNIVEYKAVGDPEDGVQPEKIQGLQAREKGRRNIVRDPAFILFGCPVEFVGSDGLEFVELRPQNFQVEIVP